MGHFGQYVFGSLIAVFFLFLTYDALNNKTKEITGTVINLTATASDYGVGTYLIVKLDNNKTISCPIAQSSMYHRNKRVLLQEITSKYLATKYRFIRYLEATP